ncbi:hypothetical protein OROGR_018207 [Orobanche gracilis]
MFLLLHSISVAAGFELHFLQQRFDEFEHRATVYETALQRHFLEQHLSGILATLQKRFRCILQHMSSRLHCNLVKRWKSVHKTLQFASDWKFGAEKFVQRLPDKVFVHCSERNAAKLTLDGVDIMGERLAEEVLEVIKKKPSLKKISFIAHSVGGFVA